MCVLLYVCLHLIKLEMRSREERIETLRVVGDRVIEYVYGKTERQMNWQKKVNLLGGEKRCLGE